MGSVEKMMKGNKKIDVNKLRNYDEEKKKSLLQKGSKKKQTKKTHKQTFIIDFFRNLLLAILGLRHRASLFGGRGRLGGRGGAAVGGS